MFANILNLLALRMHLLNSLNFPYDPDFPGNSVESPKTLVGLSTADIGGSHASYTAATGKG